MCTVEKMSTVFSLTTQEQRTKCQF
jgi:hypothetical protein